MICLQKELELSLDDICLRKKIQGELQNIFLPLFPSEFSKSDCIIFHIDIINTNQTS